MKYFNIISIKYLTYISYKNHTHNVGGKLVPDPFLKNQN